MIHALKDINWKVFAMLWVAGLFGAVAILPFMVDVVGSLPLGDAVDRDLSLAQVVALAMVQNGVLLAVTIFIGMKLSERIGLEMPLIRAWAAGARARDARPVVLTGLLVGAVVGAVLVALEALFFLEHVPAAMRPMFEIPLWKRLLAGVAYGGIVEELVMRLFLLSFVAWLLGRWWKSPDGRPSDGAFWMAIGLTALLFGLGHLPATSAMTPLSQGLVVRALILNGVAGVAFGWLYWRRGLEAAMLGHMGAHLVMQAPGVAFLQRML